ncbi:hypothetical protein BDK51DRAFT_29028 [Blyttiomyces helicus]|uniref:Uncharacterized protein n=1 Tax=Blyttiomyces helicus TaxID=388810 RepID=A0A4P9WNG8_9FUNG|nr:hypothetical protein BDK51DRAFT_29028 [Blyttiomyces helicus]|eukprot:RKO94671.1 hypothetical protein BDK51DRAFT_29028 [Blyttiomyces helicus]
MSLAAAVLPLAKPHATLELTSPPPLPEPLSISVPMCMSPEPEQGPTPEPSPEGEPEPARVPETEGAVQVGENDVEIERSSTDVPRPPSPPAGVQSDSSLNMEVVSAPDAEIEESPQAERESATVDDRARSVESDKHPVGHLGVPPAREASTGVDERADDVAPAAATFAEMSGLLSLDERNRAAVERVLAKSEIHQTARRLQIRVSYAAFKVKHGWADKKFSEVQTLYRAMTESSSPTRLRENTKRRFSQTAADLQAAEIILSLAGGGMQAPDAPFFAASTPAFAHPTPPALLTTMPSVSAVPRHAEDIGDDRIQRLVSLAAVELGNFHSARHGENQLLLGLGHHQGGRPVRDAGAEETRVAKWEDDDRAEEIEGDSETRHCDGADKLIKIEREDSPDFEIIGDFVWRQPRPSPYDRPTRGGAQQQGVNARDRLSHFKPRREILRSASSFSAAYFTDTSIHPRPSEKHIAGQMRLGIEPAPRPKKPTPAPARASTATGASSASPQGLPWHSNTTGALWAFQGMRPRAPTGPVRQRATVPGAGQPIAPKCRAYASTDIQHAAQPQGAAIYYTVPSNPAVTTESFEHHQPIHAQQSHPTPQNATRQFHHQPHLRQTKDDARHTSSVADLRQEEQLKRSNSQGSPPQQQQRHYHHRHHQHHHYQPRAPYTHPQQYRTASSSAARGTPPPSSGAAAVPRRPSHHVGHTVHKTTHTHTSTGGGTTTHHPAPRCYAPAVARVHSYIAPPTPTRRARETALEEPSTASADVVKKHPTHPPPHHHAAHPHHPHSSHSSAHLRLRTPDDSSPTVCPEGGKGEGRVDAWDAMQRAIEDDKEQEMQRGRWRAGREAIGICLDGPGVDRRLIYPLSFSFPIFLSATIFDISVVVGGRDSLLPRPPIIQGRPVLIRAREDEHTRGHGGNGCKFQSFGDFFRKARRSFLRKGRKKESRANDRGAGIGCGVMYVMRTHTRFLPRSLSATPVHWSRGKRCPPKKVRTFFQRVRNVLVGMWVLVAEERYLEGVAFGFLIEKLTQSSARRIAKKLVPSQSSCLIPSTRPRLDGIPIERCVLQGEIHDLIVEQFREHILAWTSLVVLEGVAVHEAVH